jgi:hypothetical protein
MLSHSMTTTLFVLASVRTILITKCHVIDNHSFENERDEITAKVFNIVPFCPRCTPRISDGDGQGSRQILPRIHTTDFR